MTLPRIPRRPGSIHAARIRGGSTDAFARIRDREGATQDARDDVWTRPDRHSPIARQARHLPGLTNPDVVTLCQEYSMRTGGYDDRARVQFEPGTVDATWDDWPDVYTLSDGVVDGPFALGFARLGLEPAIRALVRCLWCSADDFTSVDVIDCRACLEVARS